MKSFKRTLVTAALPYANGPKHIGHLAGAYIPADIYTRYLRNCKEDVLFVCGSDEHGTAIPIQALKENKTAKELIDQYHKLLKHDFEKLGITFDVYHRTSDPLHHQTAQDFFLDLYKKGLFVEEESEQFYDESTNTFLADRYIKGTCPNCGNKEAFGDQCEKCGKSLSPNELIDPVSSMTGKKPIKKTTKHWYLPLQNYESWLKEWLIEGKKDIWRPTVYGQSKSWIDGGLSPRAMTRDLDWGIKVPIPNAEGKVLYVWFDAPIGYISATKAFFEEQESQKFDYSYPKNTTIKNGKKEDWKIWWQDNDTRLLHFIGKDNIVFHCIIFPAMLKATNQFILPDNVPANEFLNLEGDKMSTSKKWSVEMEDYLKYFNGFEDTLRYVLTAIAPETKDSDFSWKDFQTRNNSELVSILGNFINRVMVLNHKYYEGKVPKKYELNEIDNKLIADIKECSALIDSNIRQFKFRDALFQLLNMARHGNKYLADAEPWKTIKNDSDRTATVLFNATQICANLAWWMQPFLPFSATKLFKMLNVDSQTINPKTFNQLEANHQLNDAQHLFTEIKDEEIDFQIELLKNKSKQPIETIENAIKEPMEEISFDDFSKMDIRVGKILSAEKVKKTDKLMQLRIDLGFETRTIVSGIAHCFSEEDLIGKQVSVLVNLAPRTIKGIESKGMVLMAENLDGSLKLISPSEDTKAGSKIA